MGETGRSILQFVALLSALLGGTLAHAELPHRVPANDPGTLHCQLENCWKDLYPSIRNGVQDSAAVLQAYTEHFNKKLSETEMADRQDTRTQELALAHRLTILKQYLDECEDLKRGPNMERHLLIVGHHFNEDRELFEAVVHTAYQDLLKKYCGKVPNAEAYETCAQSIVVKQDIDKMDLAHYMRFLGNKSGASTAYVGHGLANALVLGPKNLLLPRDWNPSLKIDRKEWVKQNGGMLYTEDLDAFAPDLARVMKPGAPVDLFACNTAKEFARHLKSIVQGSPVSASMVGMHFEYLDAQGMHQPIPKGPMAQGTKYVLIPDGQYPFKEVEAESLMMPKTTPPAGIATPPLGHGIGIDPNMSVEDRIARDIVLRVAINSSDQALVDDGKRMIYFSHEEQKALRALMGTRIERRDLVDQKFDLRATDALLADAASRSGAQGQQLYKALQNKLHEVMRESQKLYY